ncbi:MAG: hypothetical protein AAGC71_06325 [Pseudomonadota bacterium]
MNDFLTAVFSLATFRGTPAAMPAAPFWLAITCAVFLVVMLIVLSTPYGVNDNPLNYVAYNVVVYGTITLLLLANRRGHRLVQTLIALLAVDNLLTVAQVVVLMIAIKSGINYAIPIWLLAVWLLLAQSRILGAALEWHPIIAFVFLFLITLLGATFVNTANSDLNTPAETAAIGLAAFG